MSTPDRSNEVHHSTAGTDLGSQALDPLATVRRHPEWYFRTKQFDRYEAAALLVAEALRGGAGTVTVEHEGEWVVVDADEDWLEGDLASFVSPQIDRAAGVNSSRIEVALVAFCKAVVTATATEGVRSWPPSAVGAVPEEWSAPSGRVLAFLPPEEPRIEGDQGPKDQSRRPRLRLVPNRGEAEIASALEKLPRQAREADALTDPPDLAARFADDSERGRALADVLHASNEIETWLQYAADPTSLPADARASLEADLAAGDAPELKLQRWRSLFADEIRAVLDARNRIVHGIRLTDAEIRGASWLARRLLLLIGSPAAA